MGWGLDSLLSYLIAGGVLLFFVRGYLKGLKKKEARWQAAAEKGKLFSGITVFRGQPG